MMNKIKQIIKAFSSVFACTDLLGMPWRQVSIVVYAVLVVAFYFLYTNECKEKHKQSQRIAVLFSFFIMLGDDWIGKLLDGRLLFSLINLFIAFWGFYNIFKVILDIFYGKWLSKDAVMRCIGEKRVGKVKYYDPLLHPKGDSFKFCVNSKNRYKICE